MSHQVAQRNIKACCYSSCIKILSADQELIDAATQIINDLYKHDRHQVGAALRTKSGRIVTAVNVDAYVGRVGVCAEAIALGRMIAEGESEFTSIVAVYHPRPDSEDRAPYVVSPCGVCREMLSDYCPDATVMYVEADEVKKSTVASLLPGKYVKR